MLSAVSTRSFLIGAAVLTLAVGWSYAFEVPTPEELAVLPQAPEHFSKEVLAPDRHPLLLSPEEVEQGRRNAREQPWAAEYLDKQKQKVGRFLQMSDAGLRGIVPAPGSLFVLGLSMNLDPVSNLPLSWAGWEHPFEVVSKQGTRYPNPQFPDDGTGWRGKGKGQRTYFVALANAKLVRELEENILPALAEVYLLTEDSRYAHTAAILLDALAAAYPHSIRGPLDYPMGDDLRRYGGRLDRPTQQVARGMANYARVVDFVTPSGELESPSAYSEGTSIRENIARNLLWDGGNYCLVFARQAESLGNGSADLNYGAAIAGLLLGTPDFCQPMLEGPTNIRTMLSNNLVRQDFYFEASPSYEFFTSALYRNTASLVESLRRQKLTGTDSLYRHPGLMNLFTAAYQRRQVGGHVPLMGNSRIDTETLDPGSSLPGTGQGMQTSFQKDQLLSTWMVLLQSPNVRIRKVARRWLERISKGEMTPPQIPEMLWYFNKGEQPDNLAKTAEPLAPQRSEVLGGKGLGLLRGGSGENAHGIQLFFGPAQVKSQSEALTWTFFHRGAEWSYDPGRFNAHFRFGWCSSSVAHQSLVVNRTNVGLSIGSGFVQYFADFPDIQWIVANHPGAYCGQGVTRFERAVAQVQAEPGGDLLYWLDIGRVQGGERREDSFHTQMQKVAYDPAPEWIGKSETALFGSTNFGSQVNGDYTLQGRKEGFYWTPPGEGFGFLGNARRMPMEQSLRSVWTSPAFFADKGTVLTVDFAVGSPGRELVMADGPQAVGHPRVPYVLRGDSGPGGSVFAKLIQFGSGSTSIRTLKLEGLPPASLAGAWVVDRQDGIRDIWIYNDREGHALTVRAAENLEINTDAGFALVRCDKNGVAVRVVAEGATGFRIKDGPQLLGTATKLGKITGIEQDADGLILSVDWQEALAVSAHEGAVVNVLPQAGQASTWTLKSLEGSRVHLADGSNLLGGGIAKIGREGWLELSNELSRFFIGEGESVNTSFAHGKPVYLNGRLLGRITEIRPDACALKLDQPLARDMEGEIEIREISTGDTVALPMRIDWAASIPATAQ